MAAKSNAVPLTRTRTAVWLIGQPEKDLPSNVLPTTGDVLRTFFHYHKTIKQTVSASAKSTSSDLVKIWSKARIPMTYQPHIVSKVKVCFDEYSLIKKNKGRESESQLAREKAFKDKLNLLFDIAHKDTGTLIKIDEDKLFLEDQRNARMMKMSGEDVRLSQQEERAAQRRQAEAERKQREEERRDASARSSHHNHGLESDSDGAEEEDIEDDDYEIEIPVYHKKQLCEVVDAGHEWTTVNKRPRILENILSSPDVSSTLDRINLSDQKFTILAAAIAKASGQDLQSTPLSRSTVRRKRIEHRSSTENCIRQEFLSSEKPPLVVHWDGKIMRDSTNLEDPKSNVDRIGVSVTGVDLEKILGIVKLPAGTGVAQAKATFQLAKIWDVDSEIVGMCFDTTASNTGSKNGACVLLEQLIGRNLLYLACRHHVHEVIIVEVFTVLLGPSRGPNIALFERFQQSWPTIDQMNFVPLDDTRLTVPQLQQLRAEFGPFLLSFLSGQTSYLPREDYKEMIELCLLILGFTLPSHPAGGKPYHFRQPGAYHMARWMAKVIYCMKIFLFRNEFKLTSTEVKNLSEFCIFAAHIYVPAWIACPVASDAPLNDLMLFQRIKRYAEVHKIVSQAALKKLQNHMWYLGTEMVPLSLFSSKVSDEEKKLIAEAMILSGDDWSVRGNKFPVSKCNELEKKQLHELVTSSSTAALQSLGLDITTLSGLEPPSWEESASFRKTKAVVASLKVINDTAERSIALMSSLNQSITKTESEMQKLLQVVEDNRKRIPDYRKSTLMAYAPR
ncbi:uncharacterized protein LOC124806322 [Hydra vulgaris]|uniref:uncharacterized protein LOC124806322 n=2 Tax=Hydra vulgaris TaxID=6087 RepID=UPI001F5E740B|nr:uncharacterized protein LOC124806322 [Hydra vulgaris]